MSLLQIILDVRRHRGRRSASSGVVSWLIYAAWLTRVERRLARRKGLYRELVAGLALRERALLEPELRQLQHPAGLRSARGRARGAGARRSPSAPPGCSTPTTGSGWSTSTSPGCAPPSEWRERAFAAELLGRVGNAKAVPALLETIQATRSEDADVREIALRALARIGDPRAVEPLVDALKQAEDWLAPRIADILVRHGEPVVDPMLAFLRSPARHPARAWAANILGELKVARAPSRR